MPLSPRIETNSNGISERRSPSPKRDNDVGGGNLPQITKTAYDSLVRGNGADVNLEVKRLAQIKNLLGQAMQLSAMLCKQYHHQAPTANKVLYAPMRQVEKNIDQAWAKVPLEIKNK